MNETSAHSALDHLPFYITGPGETDILFAAVAIALVGIVVGFGALYFTIQAIPDRMVKGAGRAQMQVVGLLGLISLFTMNNLYWIAAILLAAVRIPDVMTPLTQIAQSLRSNGAGAMGPTPRADSYDSSRPGKDSTKTGPENVEPPADA